MCVPESRRIRMHEVDKIYRRPTQSKEKRKSRSKKNEKNRVRNVIMNFRVSPTEKELIENRIKLTGMLKSKFFIQSCLYQTILVKGNIKTFIEIKKQIEQISKQINRNPNLEELEPEQVESLRIILEILNTLFGKE